MAILGVPYDIMYLSRGRSGLTNVAFSIRKPDGSVVGWFPMLEGEGPFAQCYFGEYFSSIDDPQGKYFGRILSPSEGVTDTVAFELSKPGDGEGEAQFFIPPSNLTAVVKNMKMSAIVKNNLELVAAVETAELNAQVWEEISVSATVEDAGVDASAGAKTTNIVVEGCI